MHKVRWLVLGLLVLAALILTYVPYYLLAGTPRALFVNGHTMVPLRPVAKWLGMQLTVDPQNHAITGKQGDFTCTVIVGSATASVNGGQVPLPAPAVQREGETYLPLGFFVSNRGIQTTGDARKGKLILSRQDTANTLRLAASPRVLHAWQQEALGETVENEEITTLRTGWEIHRHALGFQVSCPAGWDVNTKGGTLVMVRSPRDRAGILVIPLIMQQQVPAAQILRNCPSVLSAIFPGANLVELKQLRAQPDEAAATLSFQNGVAGQANLLCSMNGRCGMLYAIGGPKDQFVAVKPTLLAVLKSFTFTQPASATAASKEPPPPQIAYERWTDPNEHAFSAEVPSGWQVSGGLNRRHTVDYRNVMRVVSPDGQITVICGDENLHGYMKPIPEFGFAEGSMYPSGSGLMMQCKTYQPATRFVQLYARKLGGDLDALSIGQPCNRPEAAAAMNEGCTRYHLPMSYTAGDVTFGGNLNGVPVRGFVTASVIFARGLNGAPYIWGIDTLYGYRAAADQEATAKAVLTHLVQTFRIDPQWHQRQQGMTNTTLAIDREKTQAISNMITSTFNERNRVTDESSRKWSNATLGQTDVSDPNTGETWKATAGHNYYWHKGDTVVGTPTYDPPDIDFSPLQQW